MATLTNEERSNRIDALLAWAEETHKDAMPWCPAYRHGQCASCAEKAAAYAIARMYLESLR